jgi:uncharacterized metal-binding protein
MTGENTLTCPDCGLVNCYRRDRLFPPFCQGEIADPDLVGTVPDRYQDGAPDAVMARAAIEVEGAYCGRLTRVGAIIAFANRIGAVRIGILCITSGENHFTVTTSLVIYWRCC